MPATGAYADTRVYVNETGAPTHFRFRPDYIRGRRSSENIDEQASLRKTIPLTSLRLKFPALGTRAPRENPTLIYVELNVTANSNVTVLLVAPSAITFEMDG